MKEKENGRGEAVREATMEVLASIGRDDLGRIREERIITETILAMGPLIIDMAENIERIADALEAMTE